MITQKTGILYVIATPIGNLKDISLRAIDTLKLVDIVVVEDTRVTAKLLNNLGVQKHMISHYDFNEVTVIPSIIDQLLKGKNIGLVTDAGTPGICDPGFKLIRECIRASISVVPIPGATACITAMSASGLPCDRFYFEGYLPKKENQRKEVVKNLLSRKESSIFYETGNRILGTLKLLVDFDPVRQIVVCKELTKLHEKIFRGNASDVLSELRDFNTKGEFTVILEGSLRDGLQAKGIDINAMSKKDLLGLIAKEFKVPKRTIYSILYQE